MTGRRPPPPPAGPPPDRELDCAAARRGLLDADPHELRGGTDTPLGRHLGACDSCGDAATRLLRASAALDRWLDASGGRPDVEAVLAAATEGEDGRLRTEGLDVAGARRTGRRAVRGPPAAPGRAAAPTQTGGPARGGDPGPAGDEDRPERWGRPLRWVVPALAAAGVVGLLLLGRDGSGPGGPRGPAAPPGTRVALADGPPDLDLEVPAETDAAVIATGDPHITVIWFLGGDR